MAQKTNQSQAPLLCSTGCGFYGNPRNNSMCSVCYKDFLQRQNSNGCISQAGSSADSSIGGSLLAPCSNSATVTSPAATGAESGHCSGLTSASVTSTEESTPGTKTNQTGDGLQTSEASVYTSAETEVVRPKAKKKRCFMCCKKVGLTGFDCRCGNMFCSIHRYTDIHKCTFDYKADAIEKIRKENPVIVGEKIQRI
uniref:Zinc finger, AN1-type domain 6 n=1 Tax=Anabas testudineus TaxID=64144 RepID=A0A7N6F8H4_ANATE